MTASSIWSQPLASATGPRLLHQPVQLLRLHGPDSLRFLHGQTSQDLALAPAGAWLSTCCITPTARLRALAEVLVEAQGALLVITAGDAAAVRQALDRVLFPADAVELGPLQEAVWLEPLDAEEAPEGAPMGAGISAGPAGDAPARPGWEALPAGGWRLGKALLLPSEAPLPAGLQALQPLDPWEAEFRRLRLGLPAVPGEINDAVNPFELGLAGRVSLSKGCYVGQETLARLATYDGVKQQLRRWHLAAPADGSAAEGLQPRPGSPLRTAAGERGGVISSCLALPDGCGWVGLALVRRAALGESALWIEAELAPEAELAQEAELAPEASPAREESAAPAAGSPGLSLQISVPELVLPPPQGAGGQGR